MNGYTLIIGDTFVANINYTDAAGAPLNLATAGITLSARVVFSDEATSVDLPVTIADQTASPGQASILEQTTNWSVPGKATLTIKAAQGEIVKSARTTFTVTD